MKLLLNDVVAASRPIVGEVNPFDLTLIESIRRFYPSIYSALRKNSLPLTGEEGWGKGDYLPTEHRKKRQEEFFSSLDEQIAKVDETAVLSALMTQIFPEYANTTKRFKSLYSFGRYTDRDTARTEKRISTSNYFPTYFRSAIPDEMYGNAELQRILSDLNTATTDHAMWDVFSNALDSMPSQHPKREDFLWKLSRATGELRAQAAENLAYAVADRAADYTYDMMHVGEAARAVNLVFSVAQRLSATPAAQRVLENAIRRASDDTFAIRIVEFTEQKDRNQILVDFSNVNVGAVKTALIERMRTQYGPGAPDLADLKHCDWYALRRWVEFSENDRNTAHEFWRRLFGKNRKRLAQAINVLYPGGNVVWSSDPTPIVNSLFPITELKSLLGELTEEEQLDEVEQNEIKRFGELLEGKYPRAVS